MDYTRFPRRTYLDGPTPIHYLKNFTAALGGPRVFLKRDDVTALGLGGNKLRKLEFLMADALAGGADTVLTCGAPQSNHCRLTAAAAAKEGLSCHLILTQNRDGHYDEAASGNNTLFHILGLDGLHVLPPGESGNAGMERVAAALRDKGRRPYCIPLGGSSPVGALGYAACADEILAQASDLGVKFDRVYCPVGSAGTQAGLAVGFHANRAGISVYGISVLAAADKIRPAACRLAAETADLAGFPPFEEERIHIDDRYIGEGYGIPTAGMVEAVRLLARTEGIFFDPVYTGKAMAGLIDFIRTGAVGRDETVLFLHTGGAPALFAYKDEFLPNTTDQ